MKSFKKWLSKRQKSIYPASKISIGPQPAPTPAAIEPSQPIDTSFSVKSGSRTTNLSSTISIPTLPATPDDTQAKQTADSPLQSYQIINPALEQSEYSASGDVAIIVTPPPSPKKVSFREPIASVQILAEPEPELSEASTLTLTGVLEDELEALAQPSCHDLSTKPIKLPKKSSTAKEKESAGLTENALAKLDHSLTELSNAKPPRKT